MALLVPFGGTGLARLVVDEMVCALDGALELVASAFAELDENLAGAVERLWGRVHDATGTPAHKRLAGDVWHLMRGADPILYRWGRSLPPGCLVLIITSTPGGSSKGWR